MVTLQLQTTCLDETRARDLDILGMAGARDTYQTAAVDVLRERHEAASKPQGSKT